MALRLRDEAALRDWLRRHRVYSFNVTDPLLRRIRGKATNGVQSAVIVATSVFAAVRDDLVWPHDPDGGLLPSDAMFSLREQLYTTLAG